ncbi:MAG: PEP/pyruvate-binding domain-containing protein [candidate division Zixibacteria bacterium]|nr:PEP/pyruvate-binding domain-containing protein [candidate division Zixibacteria bacterium]
MNDQKKSAGKLLESLQKRTKELNCLYQVEEALKEPHSDVDNIVTKVVQAIPSGLQYPDICLVKIVLKDKVWSSPDFHETELALISDILDGDVMAGNISIYYTKDMSEIGGSPFLKEEKKLINTIANRIGNYVTHQKMLQTVYDWENAPHSNSNTSREEWQIVLRMLKQTDYNLYVSIARKMLNHLCWSGVAKAKHILQTFIPTDEINEDERPEEWNQPHQIRGTAFNVDLIADVVNIAEDNVSDDEILKLIQKWIYEDKLSFLVQVVNRNLSLAEVADAIRRYYHISSEDPEIVSANKRGIEVSLIRRFLSEQLQYINVAKNYIEVDDFYHLLNNVIFSSGSHGRLGGKSAGLYLATQIIRKKSKNFPLLRNVKTPKTFHITSDILLHFMHYNDFNEVVEQKYKSIDQVRFEYPHIVQTFKAARFPTDIVKGLSVALDYFGDRPLIVRSSGLLEDRIGAAFSGKYKSLFLANKGIKQHRLEALMDAIAEVYASTFGPDPIEYRAERGLLDFGEEMGIIIQEVVGNTLGKYFLPSFAGVAFSNNEFRWSQRINQKDGLLRLVPGLGTRAVDRLSDDYPVLIAPGQPGLRINANPEEVIKYSPGKIDVINLESRKFETIELDDFLKEAVYEIPGINKIVSIYEDNHLRVPSGLNLDTEKDNLVVTFEGLFSNTQFIKQMDTILKTLQETMGYPVDIEFASDGKDFYLLQCRPQSYSTHSAPSPIPKDIPKDKIIFTAQKYISNGIVPDITHIVYVDPEAYSQLGSHNEIHEIGRIVSRLNKILPKHQFILIGPGRWGSRGDIKLGVNVTYSDINNTAVLIEVARKKGNYTPDLSFGTHFFQDLVEANIRYIPLYPDDEQTIFNEHFLKETHNTLPEVLPEYATLANTVWLINVPQVTDGLILRVLMNADANEAIGMLAKPSTDSKS